MSNAILEARVRAYNKAGKAANEQAANYINALRPLLGKKVVVQGDALSKTARKLLPPDPAGVHVYHHRSRYALRFSVKAAENIESSSSCVYAERDILVGELDNGILVKLAEPATYRSDYSAEEITAYRNAAWNAQKAATEAESKCQPFGLYDK